MAEKGAKGFSMGKGVGKDDDSAKSKKGRKVQFNDEELPTNNSSKSGGKGETLNGDWGKGGKGVNGGKSSARKDPAKYELNVQSELPKNSQCVMDCEAAEILQGIQEQMVFLSRDPTVKLPVSFDKGLHYAKSGGRYSNPKTDSPSNSSLNPINFINPRLLTAHELALYNGTDQQLPIFLGILGSVFDVTKGKSHYGVGGAYNHFAGRDASRAFVSGNFTGDGLTDTLHGLSSSEVKSVVEWRDFFIRTYIFVGKLVGHYYDYQGKPTKYLKAAEAKAARGAQLLEKQKKEEEKIPNCNSKWSEHEGGEVWCDNGYPRLMQRPLEIALTGKMSKRCVCMQEEDLEQPSLEVYEGCNYYAKACKV